MLLRRIHACYYQDMSRINRQESGSHSRSFRTESRIRREATRRGLNVVKRHASAAYFKLRKEHCIVNHSLWIKKWTSLANPDELVKNRLTWINSELPRWYAQFKITYSFQIYASKLLIFSPQLTPLKKKQLNISMFIYLLIKTQK